MSVWFMHWPWHGFVFVVKLIFGCRMPQLKVNVVGCSLRCRHTMRGHTESVNAVQFLPCSNILITCSADKTVSMWDARTVSTFTVSVIQAQFGQWHQVGHPAWKCILCGFLKYFCRLLANIQMPRICHYLFKIIICICFSIIQVSALSAKVLITCAAKVKHLVESVSVYMYVCACMSKYPAAHLHLTLSVQISVFYYTFFWFFDCLSVSNWQVISLTHRERIMNDSSSYEEQEAVTTNNNLTVAINILHE